MTDPEKAISRLFSLLTLAKAETREGEVAYERLQDVEIRAALIYVADFAVSGFNLVIRGEPGVRPWPVTVPQVIDSDENTLLAQVLSWAKTGIPPERHFF